MSIFQPVIDYDQVLNPSQLEAVFFDQGPLLVVAGAGSGKTRTLTYRVTRLINDGISPEAILLLSFTRKAAQEMLKRASRLLDQRCRCVNGGTFHSFANAVLRRFSDRIGFKHSFSIIDRADTEELIDMILKELCADEQKNILPRKSLLANIFSQSVNKSVSIDEVIYEDYPQLEPSIADIVNVWQAYQTRKREHHFLDFDDLLIYLHQLLTEHEDIRSRLATSCKYILVDEYQDTNRLQADIISFLARPHNNVMVVGDDSQSIYAFRGADIQNIFTFPDHFPGTCIIKLEENYRSSQPILDITNAIIEGASEKYSKRLFTKRQGGKRPILTICTTENSQSRYLVNEILALYKKGIPLRSIAVLFRAGFHSFDLELELNRFSIPFVKFGGFKFTEASHIKDMLAHLRILTAPQDKISWYRVLLLIEKIGPKTAHVIFESIARNLDRSVDLERIPINKKIAVLLAPLKKLICLTSDALLSVEQKGERILEYYRPILEQRYNDYPRRIRDIEQLLSIMQRYDTLETFLADMAIDPPDCSINGQLAETQEIYERLTLSTVHSAKGLEWHSVFIMWALDGKFPSHHAIDRPVLLEEERRLFYVAATRAQENLYITYPCQIYDHGTQSYLHRPSRFVEALSESKIKKVFWPQKEQFY